MAPKKQSEKKEEKQTLIERVVSAQQKKFPQTIITPKDMDDMNKRIAANNIIKTDSISFNTMTGIGGLPKGRIFVVSGSRGIGKTTTMLACYKFAEKEDYILLYVDAEHRLDLGLVDAMGIDRFDKDKFILVLPEYADQAFETIDKLLKTGKKFFIIIDSMTALKCRVQTKKTDDSWGAGKRPGQDAKMISEFLKDITPNLSKTQSMLGLISQQRMKNIVGYAHRGATGGLAPEFYATYLLSMSKADSGQITKGENQIGQIVVMKFDKTTTSLPPRPRKVALKYGTGFYLEYEAAQIGKDRGIVKNKKGDSWHEYDGKKYQGFMNFVEALEQDGKLLNQLRKELKI
jgi:recombination protein RecA